MSWSLRKVLRLPIELRVALAATLAAFALNVVWAYTQESWKIDPGTATLLGAIIGLAIVARQTRNGIANLVRSQNNQAELDRKARLHQAEIEQAAAQRLMENERATLLSALRAEIVGLHNAACNAENIATRFAEIANSMARQGHQSTSKMITLPLRDFLDHILRLT
jgi:hypothetical protein